eukprot:279267-Rhodomonas_salina.3
MKLLLLDCDGDDGDDGESDPVADVRQRTTRILAPSWEKNEKKNNQNQHTRSPPIRKEQKRKQG